MLHKVVGGNLKGFLYALTNSNTWYNDDKLAPRIIYSKRDEFGSRRPIDVIKANRPIIILDESVCKGYCSSKWVNFGYGVALVLLQFLRNII